MKFFVPGAENRAEPEQVWAGGRLWLSELGLTTRRRIEALALGIGDADHKLAVGRDTPDGELVMAILKASDLDVFEACPERSRRICTPRSGCAGGHPISDVDETWRVID